MSQLKSLFIVLAFPCFLLAQNRTPVLRHELGIIPFTVGWNNETVNQPIVGKWYYRGYYNYHFSKFAWANSFGYGKNLINDKDKECFGCYNGEGKLREYVFDSGLRWLLGNKPGDRWVGHVELGAYFAHLRYTGFFDGPGNGLTLDKTAQVAGGYLQVGLSFAPTRRSTIFVLTNYHGGKDFFGKEKSTSLAYNILQFGVGFYPF